VYVPIFLGNLTAKKSVYVCRSYDQKSIDLFLWGLGEVQCTCVLQENPAGNR